jgi:large subunit ribosomal protein L13
MKTYSPTAAELDRAWFVVDAEDKVLGRLATTIATRLRGKHKPEFVPHMDNGDFIVVINAEKVRVTGNKLDQKVYNRHSGYMGGLKQTKLRTMLQTKPEYVLEHAVKGMLPKNRLGRALLKKLKIYPGTDHPHAAQKPQILDV